MNESDAAYVPAMGPSLLSNSLLVPDFRRIWQAGQSTGIGGYVDPLDAMRVYVAEGLAASPQWADEIIAHESMHSQLLTGTALGHVVQWASRFSKSSGFDSLFQGTMWLSWHGQECAAMIAGYSAYRRSLVPHCVWGESFDTDLRVRESYASRYHPWYYDLALRGLRLADLSICSSHRNPLTFSLFANALGQYCLNTDIIGQLLAPFLAGEPPSWRRYLGEEPSGLVNAERQSGTRLVHLEQSMLRLHAQGVYEGRMIRAGEAVRDVFRGVTDLDGSVDWAGQTLAVRAELADEINSIYLALLHEIAGLTPHYAHSYEVRDHIDTVLAERDMAFGGRNFSRSADRWSVSPEVRYFDERGWASFEP